MVAGLILGLLGCTHNGGSMAVPSATPTTTMSENGMTRDQLQTKADEEMKRGSDLQAKGIADNNDEEKAKGQQLQDDAQKLLDEARPLAPSK
jgi:hypothetical protein